VLTYSVQSKQKQHVHNKGNTVQYKNNEQYNNTEENSNAEYDHHMEQ
jgi:hypothetical protein